MENIIEEYIIYLHKIKKTAYNTEISYRRDLRKMSAFLAENGILKLRDVTETSLNGYILDLERKGMSPATISRNIASVKAFFLYAIKEGLIEKDPADGLKAPKIDKKTPKVLTQEEMEKLLIQPKLENAKGLRDKAMLELLYSTGMRVSELVNLKLDDVNMEVGYVTCRDAGRERTISFNARAKKALETYLASSRDQMTKDRDVAFLFTNCSGDSMSRQGFWKLIKHYANRAQIEGDITPHTLRHTFAAHMVEDGRDLHDVQQMLGHSDISTTQMYVRLNRHPDVEE
ncbi:MAG: tyrosine recombinase [Lachnospiraceae bacterium]|nr:tyrosine recombinase [Lachnospiraceae bacterium]